MFFPKRNKLESPLKKKLELVKKNKLEVHKRGEKILQNFYFLKT